MSVIQLIDETVKNYQNDAEILRKQDAERRLAHIKDDFKEFIETRFRNMFTLRVYDRAKPLIDASINIVKFVLESKYNLYSYPSKRQAVNAAGEPDKRFDEICKSLLFDAIMDKVQKYAGGMNNAGVYVVPRGNKICLDIVTPCDVTTIQDETDPTKMVAVLIEISMQDTALTPMFEVSPVGKNAKDRIRYFIYYDVYGNHYMVNNHLAIIPIPGNPENVNPYIDSKNPTWPAVKDESGNVIEPEKPRTIIPLVWFNREYIDGSIFDKTSGSGLFDAQEQIGVISTLFNYYVKWNSFKQMYISGNANIQTPDDMLLDPSYIIKAIGEGVNVGVLDQQGALVAFADILDRKIDRALNAEGLSLSDFKQSGAADTAAKLRLKRLPLQEAREKQKLFYSKGEEDLFEVIRVVNNYQFPNAKIGDSLTFTIQFGEPQIPVDQAEQRADDAWDLQHNITTDIDILMRKRGITDRKEAERMYNENKKQNGASLVPSQQSSGAGLVQQTIARMRAGEVSTETENETELQ